jgi:multiple sugar transport system substrate-binding protein
MRPRKSWIAASLAACVVATLTACGSSGGSSSGSQQLSLWVRASDATVATKMAASYNAGHSGTTVKVTVIPDGQYFPKLGAAIAGGQAPDLAATDYTYVPKLGSTEQFEDLTERAKSLPFYPNGLSKAHLRAGTVGGKVYAMPFSGDASLLLYNKDLFKKAGLDPNKPPTTWKQIREYAAKINHLGKGVHGYYFAGQCGGCNTFTLLPFMWASGGDILNEDGTKATIAGNGALKGALELYRALWTDGVVDPSAKSDNGSSWATTFQSGKIGIQPLGAFGISGLRASHPEINFGVGYIPGMNGKWSSYAGGDDIAIPRGAKNVDKSWDFIQWSLQTVQQKSILAGNDVIPVRTDDAMKTYQQKDPRYVVAGNAEIQGRTTYSARSQSLFSDPSGPFNALVQTAVFGGDIDGAMKKAQADFDSVLSGK